MKNGVALTTFDRRRRRRAEKRVHEESSLNVLLPARFDPYQKGHDIALSACRILVEDGYSTNFTFSGMREDYRDRLGAFLRTADSFGVSSNVRAKYFVDIQTALETCDVVVSPERYCSYGLAISEALALGIPTVLSDIPTYREIARGYEHAKFFPSEDAPALAAALLEASRVPVDVADREAIRFRIAHDLRASALQFHHRYMDLIQNRTVA